MIDLISIDQNLIFRNSQFILNMCLYSPDGHILWNLSAREDSPDGIFAKSGPAWNVSRLPLLDFPAEPGTDQY